MKISSVVIGNSSSVILETPTLGIPTVNIGNRQDGRIISKKNIVNSKYEAAHIIKNIKKALSLIRQNYQKLEVLFTKKVHQKKNSNKNSQLQI